MWHLIQVVVTLWTAYIYLSMVSREYDVFHALFLGYVMAWLVTLTLTAFVDAGRKLIRVTHATLVTRSLRLLNRGRHQQAQGSITVHRRSLPR